MSADAGKHAPEPFSVPSKLPHGNSLPALPAPHFPTRFQAFLWRNWGLVPAERLARVLRTTPQNARDSAQELGLPAEPAQTPPWLERGFITLIRANWHLLPYEQLLELLGWDEQKLLIYLKEEDFLWHKLGGEKPACPPLLWHPLSLREQEETTHLRKIVERHFPDRNVRASQPSFSFLGTHAHSPLAGSSVPSAFELKLTYSYAAPCGDPLLKSPDLLYPDEELAAMKTWGINAVWLPVILYQLHPWPYAPEISENWKTRMDNLAKIAQRARRHGIAVYVYLNEPRCLPTPLFEKFPHLRGVEYPHDNCTGLCTSTPEVQEYLEEAAAAVFGKIPDLGGCFLINMSENPSHCWSHRRGGECPRCAARKPEEVMTEVIHSLERGIHGGNPAARVLVYTWAWHAYDWSFRAVDLLPDGVEVLCVSEIAQVIHVGGAREVVEEYSMSQPGPGEWAQEIWKKARERGMPIHAKIQVNTTWECGSVPYIPVADLVEEHLTRLAEAGVNGLMISWSLGGYLGGNLGLLNATPQQLAQALVGPKHATALQNTWHKLSEAFREFPFCILTVYHSPVQFGPANLLHARPTAWKATMVGFPYDDLETWRGEYPEDVYENQFARLTALWREGVKSLESTGLDDQLSIARALLCYFQSVTSQIRFIRASAPREALLEEEIQTAKQLHQLMQQDARIGYEPSNHYFYTANDLMEKVICCEFLKNSV